MATNPDESKSVLVPVIDISSLLRPKSLDASENKAIEDAKSKTAEEIFQACKNVGTLCHTFVLRD